MSTSGSLKGGARTRHQSGSKLRELVGAGKEFLLSEVPTLRAVIQRGILIKERWMIEEITGQKKVLVGDIVRGLVPVILTQWQRLNAKFCSPVTISKKSLVQKVEKLWRKVEEVAQGKTSKAVKEKILEQLDSLLDITTCPHIILCCKDPGSGCPDVKKCQINAHINCDCSRECKVPVTNLYWLTIQRSKRGEKSGILMVGDNRKEKERQLKAAKRKARDKDAEIKRQKKEREKEEKQFQQEKEAKEFIAQEKDSGDEDDEYVNPLTLRKDQRQEKIELGKV